MIDANEGRVYVRRRGRMTAAQARAVETLWDRYVIDPPGNHVSIDDIFARQAPLGVEIGFGMGRELAQWASQAPDWNFLGIEVYHPGIGALLNACETGQIENVRVVEDDAFSFLKRLDDAVVNEVRVLFPDPWPKKRHHRRRLVNAAMLDLFARVLVPDGEIAVATDWQPYADEIAALFEDHAAFRGERRDHVDAADSRLTPFERKGLAAGHTVSDFRFRRIG